MTDWHFTLSDGETMLKFLCASPNGEEQSLRHWSRSPLEKSAMKLGSGRTRYDDLLPPWYAIAQDDWSGGRGRLDLLDDPTEYWDATNLQTWIPKRLVLGPLVHSDFIGSQDIEYDPGGAGDSYYLYDFTLGTQMLAQTFTVERKMVVTTVEIALALLAFTGTIYVRIHATDESGKPTGDQLASQEAYFNLVTEEEIVKGFDYACWLDPGQYALVITATGSTGNAALVYRPGQDYAGGAPWRKSGEDWVYPGGVTGDFVFSCLTTMDAPEGSRVHFYMARGLLHAVFSGEYVGVIYRRGQLGQATAGGEYTLTDTSKSFSAGLVGNTVTLVEGVGVGQRRIITDVTPTQVTVSPRWEVQPDATTIYSIDGDWEYVGLEAGRTQSVLVVDGITYFARGAELPIIRHRWTKAEGDDFDYEDVNRADLLTLFRDENNDPAIWRALGHEVSASPIQAWGTDLEFGTEIRVGSQDSRITGMTVYDDHLYIGKEDGLWAIQEEIVRQIPVDFSSLRSPDNCKGMIPWSLYLVFPLLNGLERLYGTEVDDFGPNTGRGLPSDRQGPVSAILPLPGLLLVAIDAGPDGHSSVLAFNTLGWHEIARAEVAGERITALCYESLEDHARLWWNEGPWLRYAWMSRRTFDRSQDEDADWAQEGTLVTAWLGSDLEDVVKAWRRVVVLKERDQTVEGLAPVSVQYRVDDESNLWTSATLDSTSATRDEFTINTTGRRLQLRVTLGRGGDLVYGYTTPEVKAITVDAVGRIETAHAFATHAVLDTIAVSMTSTPERRDPEAALATLDGWSAAPIALTLSHVLPEFDGLTVMLEPVEVTVGEYAGDGMMRATRVVSLSLIEVR